MRDCDYLPCTHPLFSSYEFRNQSNTDMVPSFKAKVRRSPSSTHLSSVPCSFGFLGAQTGRRPSLASLASLGLRLMRLPRGYTQYLDAIILTASRLKKRQLKEGRMMMKVNKAACDIAIISKVLLIMPELPILAAASHKSRINFPVSPQRKKL